MANTESLPVLPLDTEARDGPWETIEHKTCSKDENGRTSVSYSKIYELATLAAEEYKQTTCFENYMEQLERIRNLLRGVKDFELRLSMERAAWQDANPANHATDGIEDEVFRRSCVRAILVARICCQRRSRMEELEEELKKAESRIIKDISRRLRFERYDLYYCKYLKLLGFELDRQERARLDEKFKVERYQLEIMWQETMERRLNSIRDRHNERLEKINECADLGTEVIFGEPQTSLADEDHWSVDYEHLLEPRDIQIIHDLRFWKQGNANPLLHE